MEANHSKDRGTNGEWMVSPEGMMAQELRVRVRLRVEQGLRVRDKSSSKPRVEGG